MSPAGTQVVPHSPREVLLILAAYALIVFPLLDRIRYVMGDEAAYLDPAINLALGEGFRSFAWPQSSDEFWACNVPLHAFLAAGWFKLFGPTLFTGRALSLCLFMIGVLMAERSFVRFGIFRTAWQSCVFATILLLGVYSTSVAHFARPDALCFMILSATLLACTLQGAWIRRSCLMILGVAAICAGVQLVVVLAWFSFVSFLFFGRASIEPALSWAAGSVTGFVILCSLYSAHGVLDVFESNLFGSSNRVQWHGFRDPTIWASALCIFLALRAGKLSSFVEKVGWVMLCAGLSIPTVLIGLSKFPQYYAIFAVAPLAVGVAAVCPVAWPQWNVPVRAIGILLLGGALALGLPLLLLMVWNEWERRDPALIERFAEAAGKSDVVFCDPAFYFALKPRCTTTYTQFYLHAAPKKETDHISLLVLNAHAKSGYLSMKAVTEKLPEGWSQVRQVDARTRSVRSDLLSRVSRLSYMQAPAASMFRPHEDAALENQARNLP